MKYRKKPVVIEAIQFEDTAERICEIHEFLGGEEMRVNYKDKDNPFIPIETLEGTMKANVGDYIIKGVNGEFYPCKPDIFEKTYENVGDSSAMDFGSAIEALKQGKAIRRKGWENKGLWVFKQNSTIIHVEELDGNESLPESVKDLIRADYGFVEIHNQCQIYDENTCSVDSWTPAICDIFAEDWEIVM